jgi:hypothetical protein
MCLLIAWVSVASEVSTAVDPSKLLCHVFTVLSSTFRIIGTNRASCKFGSQIFERFVQKMRRRKGFHTSLSVDRIQRSWKAVLRLLSAGAT